VSKCPTPIDATASELEMTYRTDGGAVVGMEYASLIVAFSALGLSMYSAWVIRLQDARHQFVDLQTRFADVFDDLPSEDLLTKELVHYEGVERKAAMLYWNLCYTEWVSSNGAYNGALKKQWSSYYAKFQVVGFCNQGLQDALHFLLEKNRATVDVWLDYLGDLEEALVTEHVDVPPWLRTKVEEAAGCRTEWLRKQTLRTRLRHRLY